MHKNEKYHYRKCTREKKEKKIDIFPTRKKEVSPCILWGTGTYKLRCTKDIIQVDIDHHSKIIGIFLSKNKTIVEM